MVLQSRCCYGSSSPLVPLNSPLDRNPLHQSYTAGLTGFLVCTTWVRLQPNKQACCS